MIEVREADRTFFCHGCSARHHEARAHESGYCVGCIRRGQDFWLEALPWPALVEIAAWIWGGEPGLKELAA